MSKPIVLFSGGLDSTVLLWSLRTNVKAISFDYGQRHSKELQNAISICEKHKIEHIIADLNFSISEADEDYEDYFQWKSVSNLMKAGSQTGSEPVPEGHYAEESMKATVVPNRNAIMLSIAYGWAISSKSPEVFYAAHAGDHVIYPDCRPEFFNAFRNALYIGNAWYTPKLSAPFINMSKADIVRKGAEIGAPFKDTWSCYKGGTKHCGKCGTCVERREAFHLAGVDDPTEYE